jgi:Phytanoyl-CoA dioxygenase (PhyH)
VTTVDRDRVRAQLLHDGYFATAPQISPTLIAAGRAALEHVHALGAPAVAAFATDALWQLVVALTAWAECALAGPVLRLPALWAWWVGDGGDPRGWAPHRDNPTYPLADDGAPEAITLWLPLTDATLDNGCIYVVPAAWDVLYASHDPPPEIVFPQSIRAVPAAAGSILGWTPRLLHWGAMARPGAPPRLSASVEFQRADRPHLLPGASDPTTVPHRADRRALIDRVWQQYRHIRHDNGDGDLRLASALDQLLPG